MTTPAANAGRSGESDLQALRAEIESLRRQLRRAQPLATVGTMTAMIVHEFNNILTPIINYAQLASDGDPEMSAKAVAKAARGGQRAIEICDALLGLLRDESAEPVDANLIELVDDALTSMGRDLAKDGIELTVDIPDGLALRTRPAEMKQVIVNLVLNARAALLAKGRGGTLAISADRADGRVRLAVSDTGCGIRPEHLDRIFEPFFTTKADQPADKGTGLGLALCQEVVTGLGGTIEVDSTPGRGSTFTLLLPATADEAVSAA